MTAGLPDYYIPSYPSRTVLGKNQSRYMVLTGGSTASGGTVDLDITPGTGYRFTPSFIVVSCERSCIQDFALIINSTVYHRSRFDTMLVLSFGPDSAYVQNAGETVTFQATNNDNSAMNMYITVHGTLEAVS